ETCARCHLVGLTSGMACTTWSSADRGADRRSVVRRTSWYRARSAERSSVGASTVRADAVLMRLPDDRHAFRGPASRRLDVSAARAHPRARALRTDECADAGGGDP